jgi:hypothetical protein
MKSETDLSIQLNLPMAATEGPHLDVPNVREQVVRLLAEILLSAADALSRGSEVSNETH